MDFIFLVLCAICVIVLFAILSIVHSQYVLRQKFKDFPQAEGYPFIGNAFQLMSLSDSERITWYLKVMKEKGKEGLFVQWIGDVPVVNVYKPEYLEPIFRSTVNISKGTFYDMLKPWLGEGLLVSTGKQWFHDRRLIGPTFHFSILDQFAVVMSEKAQILIKCLERKIEEDPGKPYDIFPFIINAALDTICETAMGVDVRAQEVVTKYTSTMHEISKSIMKRVVRPWYWMDWLYYLVPSGKKFKSEVEILHKFTKEVIKKKKMERQSQTDHTELKNEDDEFNIGKKTRKAFLDLLLDQNEKVDTPFTEEELRAQVDTFMFEGHDTTAVAVTWALFLLGNNLDHQEKVHEELAEVFGDSEEPATVKNLSELKYLDRVIKETMRILPSVPSIGREVTEEVKLDNYTIPKGSLITLAILLTHRNPEIWPDPMKFDPDRFLPENMRQRNPYAYIPFSAGSRNCIGKRFAELEEKTMLTAILRKWRVKSVKTLDKIAYGDLLVLRPTEEVLMHFTPKK